MKHSSLKPKERSLNTFKRATICDHSFLSLFTPRAPFGHCCNPSNLPKTETGIVQHNPPFVGKSEDTCLVCHLKKICLVGDNFS